MSDRTESLHRKEVNHGKNQDEQHRLVEMDGDEMTQDSLADDQRRITCIRLSILKTEYYDLGLEHRNETNDQVTVDSANATKEVRRCGKMCDDYAECRAYDGIST